MDLAEVGGGPTLLPLDQVLQWGSKAGEKEEKAFGSVIEESKQNQKLVFKEGGLEDRSNSWFNYNRS